MDNSPLSLYIHWPFCRSKCPYCDFNSHVSESIDQAVWKDAYGQAMAHFGPETKHRPLQSIFIGGGTPSLMPPSTVDSLINQASRIWTFRSDIEITMEANPTSAEIGRFQAYKAAGVNRLSLGVQSLGPVALAFLGREHSVSQAFDAIDMAARTFDRYSFDLIYARPDQAAEDWFRELEEALSLTRGHLSLYQLTIEKATAFYRDGVQPMDPDLAAAIFLETRDMLGKYGLPAYEVSNHAAPGQESLHNLQYWTGGDYLGLGPGAHGRLSGPEGRFATVDHREPDRWLRAVTENGHGRHSETAISQKDRILEDLLMGLRLDRGINRKAFEQRHGQPIDDFIDQSELRLCRDAGLVATNEESFRVANEGMVMLDSLLGRLVSDHLVFE